MKSQNLAEATREPLVGTGQVVLVFLALVFHVSVNVSRSLTSIPSTHDVLFDGPLRQNKPIDNISVFYNLFAANQSEHDRVFNLAMDQLSNLQTYHKPVYVQSIGHPIPIPNTQILQHHTNASEIVTLQALWQYCQTHPYDKVVYLHSKGSYHPSDENDIMRRLLTKGALSKDCATTTPNICNVCSYRFSPFPHPHTPGNMWLSHCSYVKNLIEPTAFINDMDVLQTKLVTKPDTHGSCVGRGRWAAEHWVHSHPSVKPCDLYNNHEFAWGYDGLEEYTDGDFALSMAPRYHLDDWPLGCDFSDLAHRLKEYRMLYNMTPGEDWWGWNFWLGPHQDPLWPIRPRRKKKMNVPKPRQQHRARAQTRDDAW
jgi:hypothetical protein